MASKRSPDPLRAVVYCRISADATGEAAGVDRQRADCERYVSERGWTLVETIVDNDMSASRYASKARAGYRRLLDLVDARSVDAVVAWHIDRLYRQPRELEDLVDRADHGLTVATLSGDLDLTTGDGRFAARILVSVAAKASDDTSRRTKRAKQARAEQGLPAGRASAFGYVNNGMTLDEHEADLIRQAAQDVLAGVSLTSIAHRWNASGVRQKNGGAGWTTTHIRTLLANPRLAGLRAQIRRDEQGRRIGFEILGPAKWPAILDRRTHERLAAKLTDPTRRRTDPARRTLLTGLVRCSGCGATMVRSSSQGVPVLTCKAAPGRVACGRRSIVAAPVESLVAGAVLRRIATPRVARALGSPRKRSADAEDVGTIERELAELAADYGRGVISRSEWFAARSPLEARRDAAKAAARTEAVAPAVADLLGVDIGQAWERLDADRRRAVVGALVDRIEITPATKAGTFNPHRVEISWKV